MEGVGCMCVCDVSAWVHNSLYNVQRCTHAHGMLLGCMHTHMEVHYWENLCMPRFLQYNWKEWVKVSTFLATTSVQ